MDLTKVRKTVEAMGYEQISDSRYKKPHRDNVVFIHHMSDSVVGFGYKNENDKTDIDWIDYTRIEIITLASWITDMERFFA